MKIDKYIENENKEVFELIQVRHRQNENKEVFELIQVYRQNELINKEVKNLN